MYIEWRLGWLHFHSRDARKCNKQCLDSSEEGILCIALWNCFRITQIALYCPCHESSSLIFHLMGCWHCFVEDLVEEIVGEGGSQSSSQVHEHGSYQLFSQQNVAIPSWFASRQTTCFAVLSWFVSCSTKNSCCHEKTRLGRSFLEGKQQVSPFYHDLGLIWLAWLGFFFACRATSPSDCRAISEPKSFIQSCAKEIFGGGWSDAKTFSYYDFSSFHPNNFRDPRSWECSVKNEIVQSCLLELQSFLQNKVDVDPTHRILMFLPSTMHVLCKTRCFQVDRVRILMFFVKRIHKQKEYCVCCSNFVLPISILNWWWNVNWLHIRRGTCTWRNCPENDIVL